jgi:uncharacterized protein (DUF1330 family)
MPAYIVAEIEVHDPEAYAAYRAQTPGVIAAAGGRFIVRGGEVESREGAPPAGRIVILEFPDMAAARAFYDGPGYQEILPIRIATSTGRLFIVDGFTG